MHDDKSFQSTQQANDEFQCYDQDAPKTAPEGSLCSYFKFLFLLQKQDTKKKRKERRKEINSTKAKTMDFQ